jgi:hypothetical protein
MVDVDFNAEGSEFTERAEEATITKTGLPLP